MINAVGTDLHPPRIARAVRMMPAISSVTRTMVDDRHSGITCSPMIRTADAPCICTAAMNSALRKVITSARAMRA